MTTATTVTPPGPETAPRTFTDQIAAAWRTSRAGVWIGAGAVALLQMFIWNGPARSNPGIGDGRWIAVNAFAVACLLGRRRWPLTMVVLTGAACTATDLWGPDNAVVFPLLVAVYGLTATAGRLRLAVGLLLAAVCLTLPDVLAADQEQYRAGAVTSSLVVLGVVIGAAALSRHRRETLEHRDAELAALATERRLTAQRNAARHQARVAAELHDSVGHALTAIIALSEGLRDSTGSPTLDEAVETINALARDGLADTRRAVAALQPLPSEGGPADAPTSTTGTGDPRDWDRLDALMATVRATGIGAALTETGRRPTGPDTGELVHTVVREALTNVMRHADGAGRVVVNLEHTGRATLLTVTDDGAPAAAPSTPARPGHGLSHLTDLVRERGGTLTAGPTTDGWRLHAVLPRTDDA